MKKSTGKTSNRKTVTRTVSLPKRLSDVADKLRAQDRRNFSNYVSILIEKDSRDGVAA